MTKRRVVKPKASAAKTEKKPPVPQERSPTEHKRVFDQLLDDAIFGVGKKK
jgi:hypothetical protein